VAQRLQDYYLDGAKPNEMQFWLGQNQFELRLLDGAFGWRNALALR
jgi:hypothetical protein